MFVHNINPTLFSIGPLEIRFYGIVYVLGFFLAYYALKKKKDDLKISVKNIDDFIFWLAISIVFFSRVFHIIFWEPSYYLNNPFEILKIWRGGLAFHGGLFGAALVSYWFSKKYKISLAKLADILVIPAVFALALGRIANFINGELWGTITSLPWCVQFKGVDGCRHPVQIYSSIKRFAIFGILIVLSKNEKKDGYLFWFFVLLTGIGRFFIDFMREDLRWFGLSMGQYFSILIALTATYILYKYYKNQSLSKSS